MSALPNSFQIQRERSKAYEIAVSRWLQAQRRYFVLPSYDYSGLADNKAPRPVRNTEWLVLPDLLGWNEQIGAWFEVKLKERADLYRKTNTLVTGIATRHLVDYRRVKQLTHMDVWLVFIHENERVVKVSEIDNLPINHVCEGQLMDRGGTTFFSFDKLKQVMPLAYLQNFILKEPTP